MFQYLQFSFNASTSPLPHPANCRSSPHQARKASAAAGKRTRDVRNASKSGSFFAPRSNRLWTVGRIQTLNFCDYAKKNDLKLFFLGGKESSVRNAVENVRKKYAIKVDGFSPEFEDYPFSDRFIKACQNSIREFKPDILFVGFGAGKQEYFMDDNQNFLETCKVQYAIGSGGTVDFVSGSLKRAPKWIRKIGLEGFYRFFQEMSIARARRIYMSFKFFKYIKCK